MAAVAVTPPPNIAYEDAVKIVERWVQTGAGDEDKLQFLEETRKNINRLKTTEITGDEMQDLASHAMDFFYSCDNILMMLNMFAKECAAGGKIDEYHAILPFIQQWDDYTTFWKENLTLSKSFAYQSAKEYKDYASKLQQVDSITTREGMQRIAAELKEFAQNNPVDVPVNFKDNFLDLERNLVSFQQRFDDFINNYDSDAFVQISEANNVKKEIKILKADVVHLNHQITDVITALAVPAWWELLAFPFPSYLQVLIAKRNKKQKELRLKLVVPKKSNFADRLEDVGSSIDGLSPDFYLLDKFADIWNDFHNEALDFASKFEKVENASSLPSIYKARIQAALDATDPLVDGLNAYAGAIYL